MGKKESISAVDKAIADIDSVMAYWRENKTTVDRGENKGYEKRRYKEYK